jgi:hypothetical protein
LFSLFVKVARLAPLSAVFFGAFFAYLGALPFAYVTVDI